MARSDLRKTITIYPPDGGPGQKHPLLNARDLLSHQGWSTQRQNKADFETVADEIKKANTQDTDEEKARLALLAKPVDEMSREDLIDFLKEKFGVQADKRMTKIKLLQQVEQLASNSGIALNYAKADENDDEDEGDAEDGQSGSNEDEDDDK